MLYKGIDICGFVTGFCLQKKLSSVVLENWFVISEKSEKSMLIGKRKSECSYQESNLRPSDYWFECSTTELQETRGKSGH